MGSVDPEVEELSLEFRPKPLRNAKSMLRWNVERNSRVSVHREDAPLRGDTGRHRRGFDQIDAFSHRERAVETVPARGRPGNLSRDVQSLKVLPSGLSSAKRAASLSSG
jgi:hypothetical protein